MASDIFLSYSRADRLIAEQFVKTAAAHGVNVWFDERIGGGEDWRERIVDALDAAKALVILFSEHSNGSRQLIKELAIADKMQKRVIPVLISDCEPNGAYLYEMASRNWINIYPNPETRLDPLIERLIAQLELRNGSPSKPEIPQLSKAETAPAPPKAPLPSVPVGRTAAPADSADRRWFPLGRYDLYILVPILIVGFLLGIYSTGEDKSSGLGLTAIAALIYMFVISVRNARLNRSVFSGKSYASYFAVLVIGFSPIMVTGGSVQDNAIGLIGLSLILAVLANVVQLVMRKIFQRNIFRGKTDMPLAG